MYLSATDKPLSEVLEQFEDKYDYTFSYASEAIKDSVITVTIRSTEIEEILDALFYDGIEYKIVDNNILLRNKMEPFSGNRESLHLHGKINDDTGQGLPYATIHLQGTDVGTYTDEHGVFQIEIPDDMRGKRLEVSFIGYTTSELELMEIEDEYLLLHLTPCQYTIESIVIANKVKPIRNISKDQSVVLARHFLGQNTSSLIGADVARTLQLLSGIAATDDTSTDVKIRGSNADETLMILDGMPLYHTSHYYGLFSNINPAYLDHVVLYKNAIPSYFGGKTAGVVRLESTQNPPKNINGSATLDLMNIQAHTHVPIHSKAQLSIAGRSTIRDVSNSQFNTFSNPTRTAIKVERFDRIDSNTVSSPAYRFYDFNAKLSVRPNSSSAWNINYFQSSDALNNDVNTQIENRLNANIKLGITEQTSWDSKAASIRYHSDISREKKLSAIAYLTHHDQSEDLSLLLGRRRFVSQADTMHEFSLQEQNRLTDIGLKIKVESNHLQYGTEVIRHDINHALSENTESLLEGHLRPWEITSYGSYDHTWLDDRLTMTIGARATWYSGLDRLYLSPRINASYQPQEQWLVKGAIGHYQQFVRQFHYDYRSMEKSFWVAADKTTVPVLQSTNSMIGASLFLDNWKLDMEAYYKHMNGVQEYAVTQPTKKSIGSVARDYRLFIGDGRVRGIDLELSTLWHGLQSALHYTLSKTEHRFQEIARNRYLSAEDDRRHELKWINSFTYGNWNFGANTIYASGRPYVDLRSLAPNQDIRNRERSFKRLPDYYRIDLSAMYSLDLGSHTTLDLGMSLYNALDNQNVKYVQSVVSHLKRDNQEINAIVGNEAALLGRTFNLSAKLTW